jgi:hypothetical protein
MFTSFRKQAAAQFLCHTSASESGGASRPCLFVRPTSPRSNVAPPPAASGFRRPAVFIVLEKRRTHRGETLAPLRVGHSLSLKAHAGNVWQLARPQNMALFQEAETKSSCGNPQAQEMAQGVARICLADRPLISSILPRGRQAKSPLTTMSPSPLRAAHARRKPSWPDR